MRVIIFVVGVFSASRLAPANFPVPSVSTSKNDGNDAGLIAPIPIDPDGELKIPHGVDADSEFDGRQPGGVQSLCAIQADAR